MKPVFRLTLCITAVIAVSASIYWIRIHDSAVPVAVHGAPAQPIIAVETGSGLSKVKASEKKSMVAAKAKNWRRDYFAATDLRAFVREASLAALNGDGRAAYYVGDALSACALVRKTYHNVSDVDAQLTIELTSRSKAPQWANDLYAKNVHRCAGLASDDVFANLPAQKGGYPSSFWYDQALSSGDALAEVRNASIALQSLSDSKDMPDNLKSAKIEIATDDINAAVQSGDGDALFYAGMLLSDGRYSKDPSASMAVALAACDLGHDCSADNPDNPYYSCKLSGACPSDADFSYFIEQSVGSERYAQIYEKAQNVKTAFASGDLDAVKAELKRAIL